MVIKTMVICHPIKVNGGHRRKVHLHLPIIQIQNLSFQHVAPLYY